MGIYSAPPDLLASLTGPTSKGKGSEGEGPEDLLVKGRTGSGGDGSGWGSAPYGNF